MPSVLSFGVFPLGLAGGPDGLASGPADDFEQVGEAILELQGAGPPLLTRMYVSYEGDAAAVLGTIEQLVAAPVHWDLVLCYRSRDGDVEGWCSFVEQVILRHGRALEAVQVTAEANLTGIPAAADGAYPGALEALVDGVLGAREAKRRSGASAAIGFAAATDRDPETQFWNKVAARAGDAFGRALDYAGLDLYPDVFGPRIPPEQLGAAAEFLLGDFRGRALAQAGVPPSVPIRVCESGWPTGPDRPEAEQARALEAIIRAVVAAGERLNITHWELFTLRDADSSREDLFHRFGILRDDYSRKPAFATLQALIAELG